jgi:hypothetical protein
MPTVVHPQISDLRIENMVPILESQLQATLEILTFQPIKISGNNSILLFEISTPEKSKIMNPDFWHRIELFFKEIVLVLFYPVSLLVSTNIFSPGRVYLFPFSSLLPDTKPVINAKLHFKGFKMITTHERVAASRDSVPLRQETHPDIQ